MSHKSDSLKDAVAIYKSKYIHMEEYNDLDLEKVLAIEARLIAQVVNKQDTAVIDAILKAVENGEIQTAVLIDRDKMAGIINKLDPAPVVFLPYRFTPRCPACGSDVFTYANSKYCGFCGKALSWPDPKIFRREVSKCLSANTREE